VHRIRKLAGSTQLQNKLWSILMRWIPKVRQEYSTRLTYHAIACVLCILLLMANYLLYESRDTSVEVNGVQYDVLS